MPSFAANAATAWRRAAGGVAVVAAVFCLFVLTGMILSVIDQRRQTPLESPAIVGLKQQLADRPTDQTLKQTIRQTDLNLRQQYFVQQTRLRQGGWLLLGGAVALAIALKSYWKLSARPPELISERVDVWKEARAARWSVALAACVIAGVMTTWAMLPAIKFPQPRPPAAAVAATQSSPVWPTWDQRLASSPGFRGAAGDGVVRQAAALPSQWNAATGQNVLWKSPIPLAGKSSPVVWGDRVFLTGADEKAREVFCYDAASGALVWRQTVPTSATAAPEVFGDTGFAASSPTCDGTAVYAIFATGDLAAFDFSGSLLWHKSVGSPQSMYGFASSLLTTDGKVIVQWDMGDSPDAGKSALMAFDARTGKQLWRTTRPVRASWSSPILAHTAAGDRIITSGNPLVSCYNAAGGEELWHASVMDGDVACSPVYRDGIVYVANERAKAAAIRDSGFGDVTATNVLWTSEENLPDIASPLCDGKRLLTVTSSGMITCLDAATGKKLWEHELGTGVQASPMLIGDLVYLTDQDGVTHRFHMTTEGFTELDASPLGQKVSASIAAASGKLYIRGQTHLFCIGAAVK